MIFLQIYLSNARLICDLDREKNFSRRKTSPRFDKKCAFFFNVLLFYCREKSTLASAVISEAVCYLPDFTRPSFSLIIPTSFSISNQGDLDGKLFSELIMIN